MTQAGRGGAWSLRPESRSTMLALSFVVHDPGPKIWWWCRVASAVSNRAHAAIDWKVHARDEACFVGSKEQSCRRDFLRAAEPAEWDGRSELSAGLVGPLFSRCLLLEDRRVDRAWADRIDPDATILQLH